MRTDFDFGNPVVCFTISTRELAVAIKVRDAIATNQDKPEEIERSVLELIEFYRPELKGGILYSINFSGGFRWKLYYAHPTLNKIPLGGASPELPLIPTPGEGVNELRIDTVKDVRYGGKGIYINDGADVPYIPKELR